MGSVHSERDRVALRRRVESLTAVSAARWGRMSVASMVAHLCRSARMGLGELAVEPKHMRAFQVFPLKHLMLYVLPFPHGAPTAPELLAPAPGPFEAERRSLLELLERAGTGPMEGQGPVHLLFGQLSRREWGVVLNKHMSHHLSQFGA